MRPFFALALTVIPLLAIDGSGPSAEIHNKAVTAKIFLPDPEKGYYRGTRFDWSGNTYSLKTKNHEFFGQWFPKYDPKLHDAIMGPVEEFRSADGGLGYDLAKPGETFIRIGVGVVKRADDKPYQTFNTYDIVDHGKWKVKTGRDRIQFTHELKGPNGYAYRYVKTMRLVGNEARLVIDHELKNTGKRKIETQQYNHNFFVIDGQQTGPGLTVKFPFELKNQRPLRGDAGVINGGQISYTKALETGQTFFGEFTGSEKVTDYDITIENQKAKAGVRVKGDRPVSRLVYWSIKTVFSPELYIDLAVEPGQSTKWAYTYEFYDLP